MLLLLFPDLKVHIFDLFNIGSDVVNIEPVFKFVCISEKITNSALGHSEEHKMNIRL